MVFRERYSAESKLRYYDVISNNKSWIMMMVMMMIEVMMMMMMMMMMIELKIMFCSD